MSFGSTVLKTVALTTPPCGLSSFDEHRQPKSANLHREGLRDALIFVLRFLLAVGTSLMLLRPI